MSRISNLVGFTTAISTTEDLTLASISVGSAVTGLIPTDLMQLESLPLLLLVETVED